MPTDEEVEAGGGCVECWLERARACVPGSFPEDCVVCAATCDERERIADLAEVAAAAAREASDRANEDPVAWAAFKAFAVAVRSGLRR